MELKKIRAELLEQHADLRRRVADARPLMDRWRREAVAPDELRDSLTALGAAIETHNAREETLLRGIIGKVDAWGPAREDIMDERHVDEHKDIYDALVVACESTNGSVAVPLLATVLDRILEHLGREERAFLSRDVLHDDDELVEIDYFGG